MPATDANVRAVAKEKAKRAEQRQQESERLKLSAAAVDGAEAVIAARANEQGHLFGSVAAGEIAANLRAQGFDIADNQVQLAEHIKQVGTFQVELKFAAEVTATVNVVVVPQQQADSEAKAAEG